MVFHNQLRTRPQRDPPKSSSSACSFSRRRSFKSPWNYETRHYMNSGSFGPRDTTSITRKSLPNLLNASPKQKKQPETPPRITELCNGDLSASKASQISRVTASSHHISSLSDIRIVHLIFSLMGSNSRSPKLGAHHSILRTPFFRLTLKLQNVHQRTTQHQLLTSSFLYGKI